MEMIKNLEKLVRERRSVRTYDGRGLAPEDMEKLTAFLASPVNPYGIGVEYKPLDGTQRKLSCPVVTGTELYLGGKVKRVPHAEEAFGYSMELLVLYAQSLGIGTVWVGGTMDRAAFEQAMELGEDEMMPCMTPLGYPAKKMSMKESIMRRGVRADSRAPFEALFFDGSFDTPLTAEKAGELAYPLEMVRLAPSAVNKQPWRAVVTETGAHFFVKHAKGYRSQAVGDMQKIDMGIALCHFALAAEERGIPVRFDLTDPGIPAAEDTEYIASYLLA